MISDEHSTLFVNLISFCGESDLAISIEHRCIFTILVSQNHSHRRSSPLIQSPRLSLVCSGFAKLLV